jgi:hypothetical protein
MFMPNSPSPPRGIAKREGLSNVAHVLMLRPIIVPQGSAGNSKAVLDCFPPPEKMRATVTLRKASY